MSSSVNTPSGDADRDWFIVGRWQEFEGEARANLLRIVGIAAFYIVELVNYHGLRVGAIEMPSVVDRPFHQAVTALAVAWTMMALGILLCMSQRYFPAALKYVSTGFDIVLLTGILMVADGPRSPLVVGYFLVVALSTLRFNLALIRFSTLGAMAGYLFLLGYVKWFADPNTERHVERYHQVIFLLALGLSGIVLGQVIRRVRGMAQEYAARTESSEGGSS